MKCTVIGEFFSFESKETTNGKSFFELRITQENEKGINTEVFPIFDNQLVTQLAKLNRGDQVYLDCDVYIRNQYLQKKVNNLVDLETGEIAS